MANDYAIEKLRNIQNWCGWMNEDFNFKLKSISDIEKIFDYCKANNIEFVDKLEYDDYFTNEEKLKIATEIEKMIGYKLYDVAYIKAEIKAEQRKQKEKDAFNHKNRMFK